MLAASMSSKEADGKSKAEVNTKYNLVPPVPSCGIPCTLLAIKSCRSLGTVLMAKQTAHYNPLHNLL